MLNQNIILVAFIVILLVFALTKMHYIYKKASLVAFSKMARKSLRRSKKSQKTKSTKKEKEAAKNLLQKKTEFE
jgi:hypothetical protein